MTVQLKLSGFVSIDNLSYDISSMSYTVLYNELQDLYLELAKYNRAGQESLETEDRIDLLERILDQIMKYSHLEMCFLQP